ncbi:hypothetical protein [Bacteroides sp.]|uniref:hypothetical protein n=1 Tax=Bacteroides sp. TaxID=29523 RepID=UPI0026394E49|nr:hypothetical protein [Bacteroides sp.]MDD3040447.1 hypothetical protein [Bacteroides sp.]
MNCPICEKPLQVTAIDDQDNNTAMAFIACSCGFDVFITWPERNSEAIMITSADNAVKG